MGTASSEERSGQRVAFLLVVTQLLPSASVRAVALAVAALWFAHRQVRALRAGDQPSMFLPVLPTLALALILVSAAVSHSPRVSVVLVVQLLVLGAFALRLTADLTWSQLHVAFGYGLALLVALSASAELAGVRLAPVDPYDPNLGVGGFTAWQGPFANPNLLGYCGNLALVTFLTLRRDAPVLLGGRWRWVWAGMSAVTVVQAGSSAGIAYGVALVGFLVLARGMRVRGFIVLALGLAAGALAFAGGLADRLATVVGLDVNPTLTGRTQIWAVAWEAVKESPWLGYGIGSLRDPESAQISTAVMRVWVDMGLAGFQAHNGYLGAAMEIGIPGTLLLAAALLAAGVRCLARYAQGSGQHLWPAAVVVLTLIYNVTETRLLAPPLPFLVVALLILRRPDFRRQEAATPTAMPAGRLS